MRRIFESCHFSIRSTFNNKVPMSDKLQLGFVTVIDLESSGQVGGLLVTTHLGRPLEFQCTTPVRANRTQEILYGPTLIPFLHGELIGKTLFDRLSVKPGLIVTDLETALELRRHIDVPVGCVVDSDRSDSVGDGHCLELTHHSLRFHPEYSQDRKSVETLAKRIPENADLAEPIERVRDALNETLRAAGAA